MTIENNHKTSLQVPFQLPEFIRDDPAYANFVLFLKAYYEWLETQNNVTDRAKNLLNYKDIDATTDEFVEYFYNDFLSYFPKDILGDKKKVAKIAKELYNSKGTPASYEFLFRVLYNSPVEFFYTKDAVLRASAGKWYAPKSLNLDTVDSNFLLVKNYTVFGETTKAFATIENVQFDGSKTILYISNVRRGFDSGEFITVLDSNNQEVLFDGLPLRAKVVGQVTQITIDPQNRGLLYNPGDPVSIYGGLNSNTGLGASAIVNTTSKGSIQSIRVVDEGYGYRIAPNTVIGISGGTAAAATVTGNNTDPNKTANVSLIPIDTIGRQANIRLNANNYNFSANIIANSNSTLVNAFSFIEFTTYPISAIVLDNPGFGLAAAPTIVADSLYQTDNAAIVANIRTLGILAPIQILDGGDSYSISDTIVLTGGTGYGAHANIISVDANGSITSVRYTYEDPAAPYQYYPLGGIAYRQGNLPDVSVLSANVPTSNAVMVIPGILGDGATFSTTVDRIGAISSIQVTDPGKDYVSKPGISLKVQDICVSNVSILSLPKKQNPVYQGESFESATYVSYVDTLSLLYSLPNPNESLYNLRVYEFNQKPNPLQPLKIDLNNGDTISLNVATNYSSYDSSSQYDSVGVISYGDGTAKASPTFINGLVTGQGQYLDNTGHLSSFDVLQSEIYNDFTYQITLEKEIAKYKSTLLNLLHPSGTKVLGRYVMKQENGMANATSDIVLNAGHTLGFYTGDPGSYATITADFNNASNNIVQFFALVGANLENIILPGSTIRLTTSNGVSFTSEVVSILDGDANTVTMTDNVWLTFANVAYVTANSGEDFINITSLTGTYDIMNNGIYTDPANPLRDIIYAGDKILVANNTQKQVANVDYGEGIIYLTTPLANSVNSLISVNRTFIATDVEIFGIVGTQYYTELLTETGASLITEDERLILLG
jgi:hypothetical protein